MSLNRPPLCPLRACLPTGNYIFLHPPPPHVTFLQVVVQNRRADSTEDYLNVARECCALLRKVPAPTSSTSSAKSASTLPPSNTQGGSGGGNQGVETGAGSGGRVERGTGGGREEGNNDNRPERATTEWDLGKERRSKVQPAIC